ncbi:hypothetical protein BURMUCF2_2173 [Burkholderia multivorans CF2]|nr:hypothetical protein BURMUCF2_2173 [Burkholderia multivorans CF2]
MTDDRGTLFWPTRRRETEGRGRRCVAGLARRPVARVHRACRLKATHATLYRSAPAPASDRGTIRARDPHVVPHGRAACCAGSARAARRGREFMG